MIGDYQVQIDIGLGEIGCEVFQTFRNAHLARDYIKWLKDMVKPLAQVNYICYYVKDIQGNTRREYLFGENE